MKILGISGSNREDGNSYSLLNDILQNVSSIETKIIQVAELQIRPCEYCSELCSEKPFECAIEDDFKVLFEEMKSADGIVIACPLYYYIPSKFQAFMERISCLDYYTEEKHSEGLSPLLGKPCALLAISATGGHNTLQVLNHLQDFALMLHMRPVITDFWPFIGVSAKGGEEKDAVLKDAKAIKQAKELLRLLVGEIEKTMTS